MVPIFRFALTTYWGASVTVELMLAIKKFRANLVSGTKILPKSWQKRDPTTFYLRFYASKIYNFVWSGP